jgi:hypothetical protein
VFENLLKRIAADLQAQSIPYMIIGGQAVLLYGEPRLTKDIDITLGVGVDRVSDIIAALQRLGLTVLVDDAGAFARETMVLPVADEAVGIRIDFIFSYSSYERQAIGRGRMVRLGDVDVCFASLEDLIIHKIVAGRPRDIEDVRMMLLKNPQYDRPYIQRWLKEFDASMDREFLRVFEEMASSLPGRNPIGRS